MRECERHRVVGCKDCTYVPKEHPKFGGGELPGTVLLVYYLPQGSDTAWGLRAVVASYYAALRWIADHEGMSLREAERLFLRDWYYTLKRHEVYGCASTGTLATG